MRRTRSTDSVAGTEDRLLALLLQPVAQRHADAGDQLVHAERLGHIVVGAELERLDDAGLVGAAGEDDDRQRRAGRRARCCEQLDGRPCRAGRDRAGPGPACRWSSRLERRRAVRRLDDLVALRCRARRAEQPADRRLVVDDEDLRERPAVMAARSPRPRPASRQRDGEDRARAVGAVAGRRSSRPSPRRSRGRSPARARCRRAPGRPCARGRTCRNPFQIGRRNARALVEDLQTSRTAVGPARAAGSSSAGRRVFRGIVEQIEQRLLEQHRVELAASAGRRRGRSRCRWLRQDLRGALQRGADDVAEIVQR